MERVHYEYSVHVPVDFSENKRYPIIFAMHGLGSDEQDMLALLRPLYEQFIIVAIRGSLSHGSGYAFFQIRSIGNPIREQFDQALRQLERLIEELATKYGAEPWQRYILGFSQGAVLAMSLSLAMGGSKLRGAVALSGYVPAFVADAYSHADLQGLELFISHGEADTIFPLALGQANEALFKAFTDRVTFKSYPAGHGVSPDNQHDMKQWLIRTLQPTSTEGVEQ